MMFSAIKKFLTVAHFKNYLISYYNENIEPYPKIKNHNKNALKPYRIFSTTSATTPK
jgi:hypothetical protein